MSSRSSMRPVKASRPLASITGSACARAQTSRKRTSFACFSMKCLRGYLVAHQIGEDPLGARRVLDRDPLQRAARGVHRRLTQLVGVHLAQALEALERDAQARELEDGAAQAVE